MPPRPPEERALFMALGAEIRFALQCGLGWDGAIAALQDQIARLERLRDKNVDPRNITL
jgi:hypothetical protein